MAVEETKQEVFEKLLKKFEGAAQAREFGNAVRGNEYTRELDNIQKDIASFRKRFENAQA